MPSNKRPHYKNPPVVEVVCGIQFSGVEGWGTPHFGSFWREVQNQYAEFEDQPPLAQMRLGGATSSEPQILAMPPMRRVYFIEPPGNFLIQLQKNRFLHNWRKMGVTEEYPRFEQAYSRFVSAWSRFEEFLKIASLGRAHADIFELTYINHITREGAKFPRDIWEFLAFYEHTPEAITATGSTSIAMQLGWPLREEMGTLDLDLKHGLRADDEREILLIALSARGKVMESSNYMGEWFEVAHTAIVETFDSFTTGKAHKIWGKFE